MSLTLTRAPELDAPGGNGRWARAHVVDGAPGRVVGHVNVHAYVAFYWQGHPDRRDLAPWELNAAPVLHVSIDATGIEPGSGTLTVNGITYAGQTTGTYVVNPDGTIGARLHRAYSVGFRRPADYGDPTPAASSLAYNLPDAAAALYSPDEVRELTRQAYERAVVSLEEEAADVAARATVARAAYVDTYGAGR